MAQRACDEYLAAGGQVAESIDAVRDADLVIDALFGIGLSRAPDAGTAMLIEAINACVIGTDRVGYLIKTRTGGRYTYAGIRSAWVRLCAKAGVTDLHIHDLRGRAGADLEQAAGREAARALLGHRTQRTTAHYVEGKRIPKVRPAR